MMIDLHLHSRCSDGTLTPTELVQRARLRGVTALALTDHDTLAGNEEAMRAGRALGVEVIAGVELSVQCGEGSVHLLGYGVDGGAPEVGAAVFRKLEEGRLNRLRVMVSKLNELGFPVSSKEVRRVSGGGVVGRLHIARLLVARGYVSTIPAAFAEYLGRGGKAYAERVRLEPAEAVHFVHALGGVAVLAHPGVLERETPERLAPVLDELTQHGLDGLEAYYSQHSPEQTARYAEIARERGLLTTGGSDFHKPNGGPEIGAGSGDLRVPAECLERLKEAVASRRSSP